MAQTFEPYTLIRRTDARSFRLTLNPTCGLPDSVCKQWYRRSFGNFPAELANYRTPKTRADAKAATQAPIAHLKNKRDEGIVCKVAAQDVTASVWVGKFTAAETSPRTGINAEKNRTNSASTLATYRCYFDVHVKNDPLMNLKMAETEEEDARAFVKRMAVKKMTDGRVMGGTRTFVGVMQLVTMAFREYRRRNRRWFNPFDFYILPKHKAPRATPCRKAK